MLAGRMAVCPRWLAGLLLPNAQPPLAAWRCSALAGRRLEALQTLRWL
jgi:hypothetical protein